MHGVLFCDRAMHVVVPVACITSSDDKDSARTRKLINRLRNTV